ALDLAEQAHAAVLAPAFLFARIERAGIVARTIAEQQLRQARVVEIEDVGGELLRLRAPHAFGEAAIVFVEEAAAVEHRVGIGFVRAFLVLEYRAQPRDEIAFAKQLLTVAIYRVHVERVTRNDGRRHHADRRERRAA